MDTFKFGKSDIKLPHVARGICEDAIILAEELMGEVTDEEIELNAIPFIHGITKVSKAILVTGATPFDFDPYNLSSYPIEKVEDESILDPFRAISEETHEFVEGVANTSEKIMGIQSATSLLCLIILIQQQEEQHLKAKKLDYRALMKAVSPLLSQLIKLMTFLSTIPTEAKHYASRVKRKRGAKLGGQAKANRLTDLKETVVLEARSLHASVTATKAAQAILSKLSLSGDWLNDPSGKPLLKEPLTSFTKWIRADRKHTLH